MSDNARNEYDFNEYNIMRQKNEFEPDNTPNSNWSEGMRVLRKFPKEKPIVFSMGNIDELKKLLEEWLAYSDVGVDNSIGHNLIERTKKAIA